MWGSRLLWRLVLGLGAIASHAFAEPQNAPAPPPAPAQRFAVPGSPDSVAGGRKAKADEPAPKPRKAAPRKSAAADASVATFPGFRLLPDGRSRIYVELTKSVAVDERRTEKALVYTLRSARVPVRNNKNALITTHFATPVARARLISTGPDVELAIELRKPVNATHKIVTGDGGTVRLEIDFPAGDYPLAPALFSPPRGATRDTAEPPEEAKGATASATAVPPPPAAATNEKSTVGPPAP